jgi:hypothetical protein
MSLNAIDFTLKVDTENWNLRGRHSLLTPVRNFLYEKYLKKSPFDKNPDKLLNVVFQVLALELKEKYDLVIKGKIDNLTDIGIPRLNTDLMAKLDKAIKKSFEDN